MRTLSRSQAAKRIFERDSIALCPTCHGSGRVLSPKSYARAKRGGHASFLVSLGPGRLSMSERGERGGRPREPTLEDLLSRDSGRCHGASVRP